MSLRDPSEGNGSGDDRAGHEQHDHPVEVLERRSGGRTQLRPTVFGIVVVVLLIAAGLLRPSVADPSVTGLVWAGLLGAVLLAVAAVAAARTLRGITVDDLDVEH